MSTQLPIYITAIIAALFSAAAFAAEPLFRAIAEHRERDALEMVAGVKIDLNARNPSGETALHRAVETGMKRLAQALVARGADPRARSKTPSGSAKPRWCIGCRRSTASTSSTLWLLPSSVLVTDLRLYT